MTENISLEIYRHQDNEYVFNLIFLDTGEIRQKRRSAQWLVNRLFFYEIRTRKQLLKAENDFCLDQRKTQDELHETLLGEATSLMLESGLTTQQIWDRLSELDIPHSRHGKFNKYPAKPGLQEYREYYEARQAYFDKWGMQKAYDTPEWKRIEDAEEAIVNFRRDRTCLENTPNFRVAGKLNLSDAEQKALLNGTVEITEKMDGANTGIVRGNKDKWILQKRRGLADTALTKCFRFFGIGLAKTKAK